MWSECLYRSPTFAPQSFVVGLFCLFVFKKKKLWAVEYNGTIALPSGWQTPPPPPLPLMSGVGRETGSAISPVVNGRGSVIFVLLYIHYPPWERLDIVETPEAVCLIEKKRTLPSIRRHRLFVPVWHGDRTRSHRVRLFRLFVKGPDGDQVQRHPSRVGCGQNSHVSGGGTAFVPHLARLCSGGLSGWVKCVKRQFHYVGKCNPGRETYCSLNKIKLT